MRRRRWSGNVAAGDANRESTASNLGFAGRMLLAHENSVTNIADLWVAAAMNVDVDDDPFESDVEMGEDGEPDVFGDTEDDLATPTRPGRRLSRLPLFAATTNSNSRASSILRSGGSAFRPPRLESPRRPSFGARRPSFPGQAQTLVEAGTPTSRRFSAALPTILSHTGLQTPPATFDAQQQQQLLLRSEGDSTEAQLEPILESRRASLHYPQVDGIDLELVEEVQPSMASQLPIIVIIQYGLLALHTTTHDQVFLSYLVS